ncbi:MAG TPA: DUF4388 domain-containing protein [Polyangiaceae bacterium]|nr:DUF4388 domain-containing protein [Polyangiaceae bacterium]
MPSPKNLIVLRSEAEAAPVLKLAGEIRTPGALCDVVALIAQSNWHGELVVIEESGARSLLFDAGTLVNATSTVPSERLGETLYRFGVVTKEELERIILVSNASGKRLGEAAIELDFVTAEELYPMMSRQAEEIFYGALRVGDGMFYFYDRYDEKSILRHNLHTAGLLMEGARRMDELRFFREKIPNDDYVPVRAAFMSPNSSPRAETAAVRDVTKVPEELSPVYEECDGKRSIAEIGRRIGQLEFEVTRAIFQLVNGGYVQVIAPRPRGPEAIVEAFNPGIVEIHRQVDADSPHRGQEFRDGLARFATGSGVYDALFQGAGPLADGSFRPERVARNLVAIAGDDPDAWLMQLLHEYVGFALFHAGSLLPREVEAGLVNAVTELLKPVRTHENPPQAALQP